MNPRPKLLFHEIYGHYNVEDVPELLARRPLAEHVAYLLSTIDNPLPGEIATGPYLENMENMTDVQE